MLVRSWQRDNTHASAPVSRVECGTGGPSLHHGWSGTVNRPVLDPHEPNTVRYFERATIPSGRLGLGGMRCVAFPVAVVRGGAVVLCPCCQGPRRCNIISPDKPPSPPPPPLTWRPRLTCVWVRKHPGRGPVQKPDQRTGKLSGVGPGREDAEKRGG